MIKTGDKWGALECLESGRLTGHDVGVDENGREYPANTYTFKGYRFRCVCGKEWAVRAVQFKGRRLIKDCGCGAAGFTGEHVIVTFSTNGGVKGHLQELARLDVVSVSHVINEALREYFERRTQAAELGKGGYRLYMIEREVKRAKG